MFVVGHYVPKWLPKWASQLKTKMSDLRLRNGNFPFQTRKGCELGLYNAALIASGNYGVSLVHRQNRVHGPGGDGKFPNSTLVNWEFFKRLDLHNLIT